MKKNNGLCAKLGILGGGQLGKMLLVQAQKYAVQTSVLAASKDDPCYKYVPQTIVGDLMDFQTVYDFGKEVDILTIEIEHINTRALYALEKEGVQIFPKPSVIETIQDKKKQKDFYKNKHIPTAPYQRFQNLQALKKAGLSFPFVWKSTTFGYDGMGVQIVRSAKDLNTLENTPCIIENMVAYQKEISVIVARNASGLVRCFPPVEMVFHPEANQLEYVISPARIDEKIGKKAIAVALQVADAFQHVGLLAVEMFLTKTGEVLVNETAPRTHNSGHHTIENSYTSQFEQLLRAVLNLPLGSPENKQVAVMVNLVGVEGFKGRVRYENIESVMKIDGVNIHIYGKEHTHPFRKMGHITVVNPCLETAYKIAQEVKNKVKVAGVEKIVAV